MTRMMEMEHASLLSVEKMEILPEPYRIVLQLQQPFHQQQLLLLLQLVRITIFKCLALVPPDQPL